MDVEPVALRLAHGLVRAAVALHLSGEATPTPRTVGQQFVLLYLRRRVGAVPLDDLATMLAMTAGDTLAAVRGLASEGLVTLIPAPSYAPHDVRVQLTDDGRALPADLFNWAADVLGDMDRLSEDQQRVLLGVVRQRIAEMQDRRQIPITRMCITCRFFDPYAHPGTTAPHHCHLVDAPFGYQELRIRCPDHEAA